MSRFSMLQVTMVMVLAVTALSGCTAFSRSGKTANTKRDLSIGKSIVNLGPNTTPGPVGQKLRGPIDIKSFAGDGVVTLAVSPDNNTIVQAIISLRNIKGEVQDGQSSSKVQIGDWILMNNIPIPVSNGSFAYSLGTDGGQVSGQVSPSGKASGNVHLTIQDGGSNYDLGTWTWSASTEAASATPPAAQSSAGTAKSSFPKYSDVPKGSDPCSGSVEVLADGYRLNGSMPFRQGRPDFLCPGAMITMTVTADFNGKNYPAGTKLTVDKDRNVVVVSGWD